MLTADNSAPRLAARVGAARRRLCTVFVRRCPAAVVLSAVALIALPAAAAEPSCEDWQAEFVSVEGSVEIQRAGSTVWQPAAQDQIVCIGDSVRVNGYSRAAVRLPDKTVLRLDQRTSLTFSAPQDDTGTWVDVLLGVIHIISRDPRALRFNTPYANAGLEGTEFVIEVGDGGTNVTVVEGEVEMSNAAGTIGVPSGQRGSAGPIGAPTAAPIGDPFAPIGWTPYFAPVLLMALPEADAEPGPGRQNDAGFYAARAARRIAVGQVGAAERDIERAAALAPQDPRPPALRVPLALARGDKTAATTYAREAVAANPRSAAALIALSHAQQARFELPEAETSLERAVAAEPGNALAWARLAELRLARHEHKAALDAAARAAQLDPGLAQVQTILGFAYLGESNERVLELFQRAAALDQAAPLPRVGWALALIRQGRLEQGREQLEIAVILDPTNALVRSYMAKIYAAEHRDRLAAAQLELAETLDASDPTPFLYRALTQQSANNPISALRALESANDLNGDRAVYRSRLRLDDELAVRSAGLGELYRSLGFERLALLHGSRTAAREPDDYSGHRLLADVYSALPRHQVARVDELYQAQLLQPLNVRPISPRLAESNLFILSRIGPSELAHSEFTPLVAENGLSFQGSAITAGNDTHGEDIAIAGLHDKISYSIGRFDIATDGFRENNDLEQHVTNAFLEARPGTDTSVQAELRSSVADKGDLRLLFDKDNYSPALRQHESNDSLRLGVRKKLNTGNALLASVIYQVGSTSTSFGPSSSSGLDTSTYSVEVEHLRTADRWRLTLGAREFSQDVSQTTRLFFGTNSEEYTTRHAQAYTYASVDLAPRLQGTFGVSADFFRGQDLSKDQLNPKIGIRWTANDNTTLRATAFRTLQAYQPSKQNIFPQLEPTQLAGFNQFFFGAEGEASWRYGIALDHRFSRRLHMGADATRRELSDIPHTIFLPDGTLLYDFVDAKEDLLRAYAYWTPLSRLGVSAQYQLEDIDNHGRVLINGYSRLTTRRLPVQISYFPSQHFRTGLTATYIDQQGYFSRGVLAPSQAAQYGSDSFWYFNWSLAYRLPRRHGSVSLRVDNLLDEDFRFQDTDPEFTQILPERMLSLRFTLSY
jgi:Tfp pilus assembly protein PilF